MNTNLIHQVLNIAIVVMASITAGLVATGCIELPTGALDCSASWISPKVSGYITMFMGGAKIAINVIRDGVLGMFKTQPPVV